METYINVATINHAVEATALDALLEERHIPHHLQSYHDSAYDGMFQLQNGWGCVLTPQSHAEEVRALLAELRENAHEPE